MARTKIVCTIGPATATEQKIASLIRAGMDVARLNFSHGRHDEHERYISYIRKWSKRLKHPVSILQDLQGIKIRISDVENEAVTLKKGSSVALRAGRGDELSSADEIFISYPALHRDLKKGDRVLLDDGLIELAVTENRGSSVVARVREGGLLTSRKGVNLPDTSVSLSPFTEKDREDLELGLRLGVDYVALSFVISAEDIIKVKRCARRLGADIPVIAKIEKTEAVKNIDSILGLAEGIMVARGDLGVEVSPEEVPLIQKELISKANKACKLVITATQMLESMREHLRPTRAEAADVANAVIDGTDALMLSAETSTGMYPVESVMMMERIIRSTENRYIIPHHVLEGILPELSGEDRASLAISEAAVHAADDVEARTIVAFTRSGFTARLVSKCRPAVPVIAFTPDIGVMRKMSLYWGVTPLFMRPLSSTDEMIRGVEQTLSRMRIARRGERIIIIASSPLKTQGKTNFMKIHRIGT